MIVLVDTPVWSTALRKTKLWAAQCGIREELGRLIAKQWVGLIGPIRQELLSGIREPVKYEALWLHLRGFPDVRLITADYELAAELNNKRRARGVQGSAVDFFDLRRFDSPARGDLHDR